MASMWQSGMHSLRSIGRSGSDLRGGDPEKRLDQYALPPQLSRSADGYVRRTPVQTALISEKYRKQRWKMILLAVVVLAIGLLVYFAIKRSGIVSFKL